MATQKIDPYFGHIQRIPWDSDFCYLDIKDECIDNCIQTESETENGHTPMQCVAHLLYNSDAVMNECGVEKAVTIIACMLFEMSRNAVEPQLAYAAYLDCTDLLTGDYDDLIPESDIELLRADIKTIMDYLDAHPKLKEK